MTEFLPNPDSVTPELLEAAQWLRLELARLAAEKGLAVTDWQLRYGKRESGGRAGVPSLAQWGFQIVGVTLEGALPLHVFIDEETAVDNHELAARILDLWTDRVETGGTPPGP